MYASMNFMTKSELRKAVQEQRPVVLVSPTLGAVAVNGREYVEGPWQREKGRGWHAEVLCQDARIVAVIS